VKQISNFCAIVAARFDPMFSLVTALPNRSLVCTHHFVGVERNL
jgi:hypothetical protein